jgi:hypothetical protein
LQELWESFVAQAQAYGPKAIVAALILLGFIAVAYIARWIIAAAINRTSLAKKANAVPGRETRTLGASLGAAAFWVIILVGIVQALTQLELTEVTDPLNRMLGEIFGYLPQIVGAILIFLVFLILASVASQTARAVLTFVDPLPQRFKLASGPVNISGVASVIIGVIIIVVGAIAALEALRIYSISEPATEMLREIASVLPNLVAAIVILAIFGAFAQLIASMLRRVLPSSGLDAMVARIGLLKGGDDKLTASNIVASLAGFFIVLLGLIAAVQALDLQVLTEVLGVVLDIAARIAFGAIIIFAGVFVARLVSSAVASAGGAGPVTAGVVNWLIIVLAIVLGLSRMGLDPEQGAFILDAARIVLLGAAVAAAIAFGWGGRHWAGRQLDRLKGPGEPTSHDQG